MKATYRLYNEEKESQIGRLRKQNVSQRKSPRRKNKRKKIETVIKKFPKKENMKQTEVLS